MENTKRNVEIITEYKSSNVVIGAKVFVTVEMARAILRETVLKPAIPAYTGKSLPGQPIAVEQSMLEVNSEMLFIARDVLRTIAKSVLYTDSSTMDLAGVITELNK